MEASSGLSTDMANEGRVPQKIEVYLMRRELGIGPSPREFGCIEEVWRSEGDEITSTLR